MVDDYAGSKALFDKGMVELGCMAHARRTFFDLHQAHQSTHAAEAPERIGELYRIEERIRDVDDDARYRDRIAHACAFRRSRPLIPIDAGRVFRGMSAA
ncbi:MAG: IS66 family transposase [Panacagrimonas sp.]